MCDSGWASRQNWRCQLFKSSLAGTQWSNVRRAFSFLVKTAFTECKSCSQIHKICYLWQRIWTKNWQLLHPAVLSPRILVCSCIAVSDFEVRGHTYFSDSIALDRFAEDFIHLLLLLLFFSEGTPESVPHSLLTPPLAVSPGAHPHIPLTLPRVPAHVFLGQHILSASKFNREQVY